MEIIIPLAKRIILHHFIAGKNIFSLTELDEILFPVQSIDKSESEEKLRNAIALINKIFTFSLHLSLLDDYKTISIYLEEYEDKVFFKDYIDDLSIVTDIDRYIKDELNAPEVIYKEPSSQFFFHTFSPKFYKKTRLEQLFKPDYTPGLFTVTTQEHQKCFRQQLSVHGRHPALATGIHYVEKAASFKLHISIKELGYLNRKTRNSILNQLTTLLNETGGRSSELTLFYKIACEFFLINHERFRDSDQITIYFNGYSSLKAVMILAKKIEEVLNAFSLVVPKEAGPKDIISFNPFVSGRFASLKLDDTYAVFPIIDTVLNDFFSTLNIDLVANMPVNYLEFVIHQALLETHSAEEFARITQEKLAWAIQNQNFCFTLHEFELAKTSSSIKEKTLTDKEQSEQRQTIERAAEIKRQLIEEEEQAHYHQHQVANVLQKEDLTRQDLMKYSARFFYKLVKKSADFCAQQQAQEIKQLRVLQQATTTLTRNYESRRNKLIKRFDDGFNEIKSLMQQELEERKLESMNYDYLKAKAISFMSSKEILALHTSLFEQLERDNLIKAFSIYPV